MLRGNFYIFSKNPSLQAKTRKNPFFRKNLARSFDWVKCPTTRSVILQHEFSHLICLLLIDKHFSVEYRVHTFYERQITDLFSYTFLEFTKKSHTKITK